MIAKRVLAFHYAWYGTPWGPTGAWRGWNSSITRGGETIGQHDPDQILPTGQRDIGSMLYPLDGPYDSREVSTVRRQLAEAREAGIDGFMLSWWGPGDQSDKALEVFIAECPPDFICVNFETPYAARLAGDSHADRLRVIQEGMLYLLERYASSPKWIRLDGRPLMAIWRAEHYAVAEWQRIKEALRTAGFDVFWLGQHYESAYVPPFDALCTYTPFLYTLQGVDLKQLYRQKRDEIKARGGYFAATANPGFDNRALHRPGLYVPRENGGYYRLTWEACLTCAPDFVVINSFNEWGESSVIESTRQFGTDYLAYTRAFAERFRQG